VRVRTITIELPAQRFAVLPLADSAFVVPFRFTAIVDADDLPRLDLDVDVARDETSVTVPLTPPSLPAIPIEKLRREALAAAAVPAHTVTRMPPHGWVERDAYERALMAAPVVVSPELRRALLGELRGTRRPRLSVHDLSQFVVAAGAVDGSDRDRARALNVSLPTFYRRLRAAREHGLLGVKRASKTLE
jgi:hypothetical protein